MQDETTRNVADDHRALIDRIDKTIIALLTERLRLDRALGGLNRDPDDAREDTHERDR